MGKLLFRLARLKIMGTLVGFALAYFPFLVPVKKIKLNKYAISFTHPVTVYPDHVLIIPRRIVRTVFGLSSKDCINIIEMAVKIRHGDSRDFVLLINGGDRQDVMQAHFHLFTGNLVAKKELTKTIDSSFILQDGYIDSNLRSALRLHNVNENSFSMIIQFNKDAEPSMYLD